MLSATLNILLILCTILIVRAEFKDEVVSFFKREKCMDELGCFNAKSPFFDVVERPLSLLPDDRTSINVHFMLFTRHSPQLSLNFSNLDNSIDHLLSSGFDPTLQTKFIIPGFISSIAPYWQTPLKDALLNSEPCNVFFVDWSGGDGPLYEQAVANTRVVGAEITLFITKLQKHAVIAPESVHLIGHSLGAHIAGYAGKRISGLGRITAMDPAGPYFTNVDSVVRLDRTDALFVDVIHTNAAPSRFQGFGLTESIGHFDFYPNGGHLQPGCDDMGHGILHFLNHPTFDAEGLEVLQCNHARAIHLFTSSLVEGQYQMLGLECGSWEDFSEGKCGNCKDGPNCIPLGVHSVDYKYRIYNIRSIDLYLNTTATEPFCVL